MKNEETKPTTPSLSLIVKIAIAMTAVNTWVIFEEVVVDRHGLWRYMPFYRVGLFCAWDASVLTIILLVVLLSIAPLRSAAWRMVRKARKAQKIMNDSSFQQSVKEPTPPPLPLIVNVAIGMTFLNTLIILFVWPGVLLRVCF